MNIFVVLITIVVAMLAGIFGVVYPPYGEEATTDLILPHFVVTVVVMMSIALVGFYMLLVSRQKFTESYARIVTAFFLIIAAILNLFMFYRTYEGFSALNLVMLDLVIYTIIFIIWVLSDKVIATSVSQRESTMRVNAGRKSFVQTDLYVLANNHLLKGFENTSSLQKAIENLSDELKYFPNMANGAEADGVMKSVKTWIQQVQKTIETCPKDKMDEALLDLILEAKAVQRAVALYKKV